VVGKDGQESRIGREQGSGGRSGIGAGREGRCWRRGRG
jgi:hypothetical protein